MIKEKIEKAMSYNQYRQLMEDVLAEGKTTGPNQSEDLTHYTTLNHQRMKRLDKTTKINDDLVEKVKNLSKKYTFLTLTEAWCGDAAQNIPVIEKMADLSDKIITKYVLRDENLDLMDEFLTNGGRSIPKVIVVDENYDVKAMWGPRPQTAQRMVMDYKEIPKNEKPPYSEFVVSVQKWYAKNRTKEMQSELLELVEKLLN